MTRESSHSFDMIVIGGGIGGFVCAGLTLRRGLTIVLLEAHTRL